PGGVGPYEYAPQYVSSRQKVLHLHAEVSSQTFCKQKPMTGFRITLHTEQSRYATIGSKPLQEGPRVEPHQALFRVGPRKALTQYLTLTFSDTHFFVGKPLQLPDFVCRSEILHVYVTDPHLPQSVLKAPAVGKAVRAPSYAPAAPHITQYVDGRT